MAKGELYLNYKDKGMNKEELIGKQQIEIERLKFRRDELLKEKDAVYNIIYCIGGPLNDNKLGYTNTQMQDFWKIIEALDMN